MSARRSGTSTPRRSRSASSLAWLRPASAQRVPSGACSARYSAVRPPVKPVAPNRTMSCSRDEGAFMPAVSPTGAGRDARPAELGGERERLAVLGARTQALERRAQDPRDLHLRQPDHLADLVLGE